MEEVTMPAKEIPLAKDNILSLYFPENLTIGVLHLGKSEIHIKVSPAAVQRAPAPVAASEEWDVPEEVLAYCDQKAIRKDFETILGIVKTSFPDLRQLQVSLDEHEFLGWAVLIQGVAPGIPEVVAKRTWDCIAIWADAVPRSSSLYFLLTVRPEGE
jgi:hypothetical protein